MSSRQAANELLSDLTRMVTRLAEEGYLNELLVDPSWIVRTMAKNIHAQKHGGQQSLLEPLIDMTYGDWKTRV